MSLIPSSQFELSRTRRDLKVAMKSRDWGEVSELDGKLLNAIDVATMDEQRDIGSLLNEMGELLKVYKELIQACHEQERQLKAKVFSL